MQDAGYAYLIPDSTGVKHLWVVQGSTSFSWVDVGVAGVGVKGEDGAPGIGIDALFDMDMQIGDVSVTYDTTDGMTIDAQGRARYTNGGEDVDKDFITHIDIPIKGGNNISIDKASDSEFVEVKLDETQPIALKGNNTATFKADYSEQYRLPENWLYMAIMAYNKIRVHNPNGDLDIVLPEADSGASTHYALTNKNVKTLFGDKSIYGSGNIDLYKHHLQITVQQDDGFKCFADIYSSKSLIIDSLTDLKTLLGDTFQLPVSGGGQVDSADYYNAIFLTESYMFTFHNGTLPVNIQWNKITIEDTVTTI